MADITHIIMSVAEAQALLTKPAIPLSSLGQYELITATITGHTIPGLEVLVHKENKKNRGFIAFWWNCAANALNVSQGAATTMTNALTYDKIRMSNIEHTTTIVKTLDRWDTVPLVSKGALLLPHVLGLISWIPDMSQTAVMYSMKPDQGVEVVDNYADFLSSHDIPIPEETLEPIYNSAKMACQGYAVLIAMVKPTSGADFSGVIRRRMKAFSYTLGIEGSYMDPDVCQNLVGELRMMSEKISFFPVLQSRVFTTLIASTHQQTSHVREIFRQASLTVFGFINLFLKTPNLTLLHLEVGIYSDIRVFHDTFTKIYNKYGENWVYFRLLEPNNTDTSSKRFPSLAMAALSWMHVTTKANSLLKFQGVSVSDAYVRLASKPLNQRYLKTKGGLNKDMTDYLEKSGLYPGLDLVQIRKDLAEGIEMVFSD